MSLESQLIVLQDTLEKLLHWIDSLSEDELFFTSTTGLGDYQSTMASLEMDSH